MGRRGVVAAGHYLAASAGLRIMVAGGNAIDAAAAMGICETLLEPQSCGIGGEVPTLIYSAKERRTYAISGMGWSPEAFTIDWCRDHGIDLIPGDGYLPACVPAPVDTWATALARFGTMSFAEILQPTIEFAEQGFPVYASLSRHLHASRAQYAEQYPTTGAVYLPDGSAPNVGDVLRNPDFGAMLRIMCRAEEGAKGRGRVAGIEAARDAFYRGEIAERIVRFIADHPVADASGAVHAALMTYDDLAEWHARVEDPVTLNYRGLDVYKCSSWTQGPVFLQQLAILQGLDLKAMGHNSADYLHTWIETAKLAFADREAYYGDPDFDAVPFDVLLSAGYGERRAAQIGQTASLELRPGDLGAGVPEYAARSVREDNRRALGAVPRDRSRAGEDGAGGPPAPEHAPHLGDTTHLDAVDAEGNMVAATPSGGWIGSSPVIAGLGFPLGTRGQMFYLNPQQAQRAAAAQAAAGDSHAHHRHQGRRTVHGVRHPRRRRPGPMDAPVLPELRGVRHGPAAGARRAHRPHHALSLILLPARGVSRPGRSRIAPTREDARGVAPARPRHRTERRLESRQGAGDPLPRRPRLDRRSGNCQERNRLRRRLVIAGWSIRR